MYHVLGSRSINEGISSSTTCILHQAWSAWPLTPFSSNVNDSETLTGNHLLLGNNNDCLPCLPCADQIINHQKIHRETQFYADLISDRFLKEYLPTLNNWRKFRSRPTETLTMAIWFGRSVERGYYNKGQDTATIEASDCVIRSAEARTIDRVRKKIVVRLAPVPNEEDIFAMENRAVMLRLSSMSK